MIKKLYQFIKKIIVSSFFLYGYNLIAAPLNLFIPINLITVLLLSVLGIPSMFALMVIFLLI
jgi:SigmaK-factor processing regulatory protein BofA.